MRPGAPVLVLAALAILPACSSDPPPPNDVSASVEAGNLATTENANAPMADLPSMGDLPPLDADAASLPETERDWAIARGTIEWARSRGLSDRPIGEVVAAVGATFVGTPYEPGTLEIPGPERLVVNLRAFDCVTLVEHVLVISRLVVASDPSFLETEQGFRERYRSELTRLRYRGGVLSGYPSRLHYFSEWIGDAQAKGILQNVTRALGGVPDPRPIDFMSEHTESYRQLQEDPSLVAAIRATEERLNQTERFFIPQDEIAEHEAGIHDGDVIAAVSALDGLDIAHTGIAVRRDGRVHLLHAPLVGDSVQISEIPLAERIQGISSQVGIMVARPLQP